MLGHRFRRAKGWLAVVVAAAALGCPGCRQPAPPPAPPSAPPPPASPPPAAARPAPSASPADSAKAFLADYLGDAKATIEPGTALPVAHETQPQVAYKCTWPAGRLPAGTATVEVDKGRGYVSLAILRWPKAPKAKVTDEQLRATALERLHQWAGPGVDDARVAAEQLGPKALVAFLWEGRNGDHYSGQRAHVVVSRETGLPVSFKQYRPAASSTAPKVLQEQAVKAALAALSPMPSDFHQTGTEARLYDHSPLAKDEGPAWAVAISGTQGKAKQPVQAGTVIDAVTAEVLAPKPKAKPKPPH